MASKIGTSFLPLLLICALGGGAGKGQAAFLREGTPVAVAPGRQGDIQMVSDGEGGVIVCWQDTRSDVGGDIYAQRIDRNGQALWAANGVLVGAGEAAQVAPQLCSDGLGGAVVMWHDLRNGPSDGYALYAQRVGADGGMRWAANGVELLGPGFITADGHLVGDGAGGAIVVCRAGRHRLVAQRVGGDGGVLWGEGVPLFASDHGQLYDPAIVPDGAGGALVAWYGGTTENNVFLQRLTGGGARLFGEDGVKLSHGGTTMPNGGLPLLAADGAGGAFVGWTNDHMAGPATLYVQKVSGAGVALWAGGGIPVVDRAAYREMFRLAPDGQGGCYAVWVEVTTGRQIARAQRVGGDGSLLWHGDGVRLMRRLETFQLNPRLVVDGRGLATVVFQAVGQDVTDMRNYAQRLDLEGNLLWGSHAIPVSEAPKQTGAQIAVSAGGVVVLWGDQRHDEADLFCTSLTGRGIRAEATGSSLAFSQKLRVGGNGGWQSLFFNYGTQELRVSPYRWGAGSVPVHLPVNDWTGSFHYDYEAGAFTQAAYSTADLLE